MLSLFRTLSLRYLAKHWSQSVLVVVSIALGVATWVATDCLSRALDRSLRQAITPLPSTGADLYVTNSATEGLDGRLADRVQVVPGVKRVQPLLIQKVTVALDEADLQPSGDPARGAKRRGQGILAGLSEPDKKGLAELGERGIEVVDIDFRGAAAALIQGETPVLVNQDMDENFLGNQKQFVIAVGSKARKLRRIGQVRVHGPAAALGGYVMVTKWTWAAEVLDRKGRVDRLDVTLEPDTDRAEAVQRIKEAVGGAAKVQTTEEQDRRLDEIKRGMRIAFLLCGAGALVVGLFLVYNVMSVSVSSRRHDIGILRSIGATRAQVRGLFLAEAVLMGLAGSAVGIPLGLGLATACLGPMQRALHGLFRPLSGGEVETTPELLMTAALGGLATALLAALVPASQAASEEPADAVRRAPPSAGLVTRLLQVGGGLTLIGLGALVVVFKLQAERGLFVSIALCFVGALILGSRLASAFTRLVVRPLVRVLLPVPSRLAADNLVRSPGRTGLVMAAFAACVALMVLTAGVIRSNEGPMLEWLDATYQADLYVSAFGPASAVGQTGPMEESVGDDLRKVLRPRGLVGVTIRYIDWNPEDHLSAAEADPDRSGTVVFLVLRDVEAFCRISASLPSPDPHLELWRKVAGPGRAIVSENFALIHHVRVGDTIQLDGNGGPVPLKVVGTLPDYNWIRGAIFVDRQANKKALRGEFVTIWEVYLPPGSDTEHAREELMRTPLAVQHALTTRTQQEMREGLRGMINRVYGVVYTQQLIVGVVAVLGVVASLLISVLGRRRELGILRAVGGTRPQILQTVLAEAVLIGLVGVLLGIVVGLPMEWFAVRVVLFGETGFLFPVRPPWVEAGVIAALSMLAATLAGIGPAIHATRLRIADAIAFE